MKPIKDKVDTQLERKLRYQNEDQILDKPLKQIGNIEYEVWQQVYRQIVSPIKIELRINYENMWN